MLTVAVSLPIRNDCRRPVAGSEFTVPVAFARSVHVPAVRKLTAPPETVHLPGVLDVTDFSPSPG